jgi:hypothetical protein
MINGRWCAMGAGTALLALLSLNAASADPEPLMATVGKPAVITATPSQGVAAEPGETPQVVIRVTGFQPAQDGPVEAVVKAQQDGKEQEIGRFGIFPYRAFTAADRPKGHSFGLPLPKELANRGPLKLTVYLVPATGQGKGASIQIGSAEIR